MERDVATCAEYNIFLPKEQSESRKAHRSIHQATNKRLLYN